MQLETADARACKLPEKPHAMRRTSVPPAHNDTPPGSGD